MQDDPPGAQWLILRLLRDVWALDFESLIARTGLGAQTITRQLNILKTIGFVGLPVSRSNDRHGGAGSPSVDNAAWRPIRERS